MKKLLVLACVTLLMVSGCVKDDVVPETPDNPVEDVTPDTPEIPDTPENPGEQVPDNMKSVNVYHPDEEFMEMISTTVDVEDFDADALMEKIAEYNGFPEGTKVLSMTEGTEEVQKILFLDLSEEFKTYVCSMGTSGEFFAIQGVVNSFVEAYEADGVRLTVAGMTLETGHNIYDYVLTFAQE